MDIAFSHIYHLITIEYFNRRISQNKINSAMITKKRKSQLIQLAEQAINEKKKTIIFDSGKNKGKIKSGYNSQISAFPVQLAMSGLKTAIVSYLNTKSQAAVDKSKIIDIIRIIRNSDDARGDDEVFNDNDAYRQYILELNDSPHNITSKTEKREKELILQYATAVKLVIRTHEFSNENEDEQN